ncbi:hypothetical protein SAMN02745866_04077 [Alteromonadaceae bacterium Bs31]|nr:hypothetical protein SAMN02745866_04077 [Alteromonadaceae bacterium Bs31]
MNRNYISESLIEILDLLAGSWSISHYQLVHHGWVCTIRNIDSWPAKASVEIFLHSEEGYVDVCESNKVDSKAFAKGMKNPIEIAGLIEANVT